MRLTPILRGCTGVLLAGCTPAATLCTEIG
jgi:hypothetical protein